MFKPRSDARKPGAGHKAPLTLQQQLASGRKLRAARVSNNVQGRKKVVAAGPLPPTNAPVPKGGVHVTANHLLTLLLPTAPLASGTSLSSRQPDAAQLPFSPLPPPPPSTTADLPPRAPIAPSSMQTNRTRVLGSNIFFTDSASPPRHPHYPPLPPAPASYIQPTAPAIPNERAYPPPTFVPLAHTQYAASPQPYPDGAVNDPVPTANAPPTYSSDASPPAARWGSGQHSLEMGADDERSVRWRTKMAMRDMLDQQIAQKRALNPLSVHPTAPPPADALPLPPRSVDGRFGDNRAYQQASSVLGGGGEDPATRRARVREETAAALLAQIEDKKRREEERKRKEDEDERRWDERVERERRELANRAAGIRIDVAPPQPREEARADEEKQQLTMSGEVGSGEHGGGKVGRQHRASRRKHRHHHRRAGDDRGSGASSSSSSSSSPSSSSTDSDADDHHRHRHRHHHHRRRRQRTPSPAPLSDDGAAVGLPEPSYAPQTPSLPPPPIVRPPFGVRSVNTKASSRAPASRRPAVLPPAPAVSEKVRRQMTRAENLARGRTSGGGERFVDRRWKARPGNTAHPERVDAPGRAGPVDDSLGTQRLAEEVRELEARLDTGLSLDRLDSTSEWLFPHSVGLPSYRA